MKTKSNYKETKPFKAVSKMLDLDESHIPLVLLTLGYRKEDPRPRSPRRPIAEVAKMDTLNGPGLMARAKLSKIRALSKF